MSPNRTWGTASDKHFGLSVLKDNSTVMALTRVTFQITTVATYSQKQPLLLGMVGPHTYLQPYHCFLGLPYKLLVLKHDFRIWVTVDPNYAKDQVRIMSEFLEHHSFIFEPCSHSWSGLVGPRSLEGGRVCPVGRLGIYASNLHFGDI